MRCGPEEITRKLAAEARTVLGKSKASRAIGRPRGKKAARTLGTIKVRKVNVILKRESATKIQLTSL